MVVHEILPCAFVKHVRDSVHAVPADVPRHVLTDPENICSCKLSYTTKANNAIDTYRNTAQDNLHSHCGQT